MSETEFVRDEYRHVCIKLVDAKVANRLLAEDVRLKDTASSFPREDIYTIEAKLRAQAEEHARQIKTWVDALGSYRDENLMLKTSNTDYKYPTERHACATALLTRTTALLERQVADLEAEKQAAAGDASSTSSDSGSG